jgi:hypothetical protein
VSEKITITYYISDWYVGNRQNSFKIDRDEWNEMNDDEKYQYCWDVAIARINVYWKES